jgi:ABC-2 type transport system permease protein
MIKSMPEGFLNAFGFENGLGNLEDFMSGEYYGLIFIVILSIFSVMLSTKLLAKLVDQGSMAYILSAPTLRGKVAFTQAAVLTTGLLIIMAVTTAAGLAGYHLMLGGDYDFNVSRFLVLNLLGFLLFFAVRRASRSSFRPFQMTKKEPSDFPEASRFYSSASTCSAN